MLTYIRVCIFHTTYANQIGLSKVLIIYYIFQPRKQNNQHLIQVGLSLSYMNSQWKCQFDEND